MNDLVERLRVELPDMEYSEHARKLGEEAADRIEALERECEELKHDIARHIEIASSECNHAADYKAACDKMRGLLVQYRNDLRYPPSPSSKERRLAAINGILADLAKMKPCPAKP